MIKSHHDTLFKDGFWHPPAAWKLANRSLPKSLVQHVDWSSITRVPGDMLSGKKSTVFTDAVFEVPFQVEGEQLRFFLHIHLEHQSKSDPNMLFRCLQYTAGLLANYARETGGSPDRAPAPIIIPVVVSHDPKGWSAPQSLDELYQLGPQTEPLTRDIRPRFRFHVDDLSRLSDEELQERALDRYRFLVLFALRDGREHDLLERIEEKVAIFGELLEEPEGDARVGQILWYFFHVNTSIKVNPDALAEAVGKAGPRAEELARAKVLAWEQEVGEKAHRAGRQEGREEGREETREEERADFSSFVIQEVERKFGPLSASRRDILTRASKQELRSQMSRLVDATTLEELFE